MYKWYQVLVQDLDENVDQNLAWLTQRLKIWKCKCDWTELESSKKSAPPHFYINPTFQVIPPFSQKISYQVTQFLEGMNETMKLPNKNDNNKTKIQLLDKTNMLQINFITYKGN